MRAPKALYYGKIITMINEKGAQRTMIEIYCDSSYNENADSYIGCLVLKGNNQVHQSTTKIGTNPKTNLDCEKEAIKMALSLAGLFGTGSKRKAVTIYNDSTEAIKYFRDFGADESNITAIFEYTPREKEYQSIADSLSKNFPRGMQGSTGLTKRDVGPLAKDTLSVIATNKRSVFYLQTDKTKSTKSKTCYKLVIQSTEKILSDDRLYYAKKGGEGTHFNAALQVCTDISTPEVASALAAAGVELENSYFLLTNETWGLRGTDNKAFSILPHGVKHRIICDEVNRSAKHLFQRIKELQVAE